MRWELVFAWSVAAVCSVLALRLLRTLTRLVAPDPNQLLSELLAELAVNNFDSEFARQSAIAELNRRLSDISFELGSLPARFTALTRISLASGTALALFRYIGSATSSATPMERVLELIACGASGVVGAACVLAFGRAAKLKTAVIREQWDRSSREAGKSLGTSLEAPARERPRRE